MSGASTSTRAIPHALDPRLDGLVYGVAWDGVITYAFPMSAADFAYETETGAGFGGLSASQQRVAKFAIDQVNAFSGAAIVAGDSTEATIRLARSDAPHEAYAYMPGSFEQAGDIWLGPTVGVAKAGNYAWHTVLHEIGHALGLKHGHAGPSALPNDVDAIEYSVMTYRTFVGGAAGSYSYSAWSAPQTYMMLDIAALQHIYGADYTTHSGDTVYRWKPSSGRTMVDGTAGVTPGGNRIFATIWDGGGNDTYDLSAYKDGVTVDLRPGESSTFSKAQLADLGRGHHASGNIYNALLFDGDQRSLIENAIGGRGDDEIRGNAADNVLTGGRGADSFVFRSAAGHDVVMDFDAGVDRLVFSQADGWHVRQAGRDVIFVLDEQTSVTLLGVRLGDLDFV